MSGHAGRRPSLAPWLLVPALATMLVPFAWMLFLSVQPGAGGDLSLEALGRARFTLAHYLELVRDGHFPRYLVNSLVVAAFVVAGNVMTGAMVGYALARKRFPGRGALTWGVIAGLVVLGLQILIGLDLWAQGGRPASAALSLLHLVGPIAALAGGVALLIGRKDTRGRAAAAFLAFGLALVSYGIGEMGA